MGRTAWEAVGKPVTRAEEAAPPGEAMAAAGPEEVMKAAVRGI
jgi:hypothetical protein